MTSRGNSSCTAGKEYEQQVPSSRRSCHGYRSSRSRQASARAVSTPEAEARRHRNRRSRKRKQTHKQSLATPYPSQPDFGSSSSAHRQQAVQESDIPGYYYDEEKKTYFKILPNTMSSVGSFVTKETIKKKEAEKQRLSDLKTTTGKPVSLSAAQLGQCDTKRRDSNLINILRDVQCGQFTCRNLQTYMIRNMCLNIQRDVGNCNWSPSMELEDIQKMDVSPKRDKLVCVTSVKACLAQCIQLMTVKEQLCPDRKEKNQRVFRVIPPDTAVGPIYKKVSSLCWAPLQNLPGKHTVLYTTMCPIGCFTSIVCVCNLDAPTSDTMKVFEFNLGFKTVWSSAWSSHQSRFSVGSERKCHLVDITTRRQWTFGTYNSDPLAQLFSPTNASMMYNGTRAGLVLIHDLRTPGRHQAQASMRQGEGVGCLRLMQDENYILASDFTGTIYTWDQRMRRKINKYTGLVNSHYQLPFDLDETETLICATGSDSYTKLWDRRSAELLRSLPPPYAASLESFPLSFYSNKWGDVDGNSAVLIAMRNRFEFYR